MPEWLKEGFLTPFENCTVENSSLPKKTSAVSCASADTACAHLRSLVHVALPSEQCSESRKHLQDEPQWSSPPHCLSAVATWKTAASPRALHRCMQVAACEMGSWILRVGL